jgi:nucleotide-binding universal stress UspA family protein
MHAYEVPMLGIAEPAMLPTGNLTFQVTEAARRGLQALVESRRGRGVAIDSVLCEGAAWEAINRVADEIDADLVVLGTHGRKGLQRALLGSVAEHVVRTSHRPVLTIHASAA